MTARPNAQPILYGDELHALLRDPLADEFPNLADQLYERLWRRIVNQEFAPGQRLSEESLAFELGVSRTPVREALYRLGQVGLVRVTARRGFSVPAITESDINELFDLRTAVEVFATKRAAPLLTDEEIETHRDLQRLAHQHPETDPGSAAERFWSADLKLHDLIQQRGGNRRSVRLLGDVVGQIALLSIRAAYVSEDREYALREHALVLDALAARDPDVASATMEAHIQAVKNRRLKDIRGDRRG